jgi:hypothetical protein
VGALATALMTTAVIMPAGAAPTRAITGVEVAAAVKAAYDTYQKYLVSHLSLEQATSQIIAAINAASVDIRAHIDQIAASEVQGCARTAVVNFSDIRGLTHDQQQAFALDTTACVEKGLDLIRHVDKPAISQLGFAINIVGPIALIARAYVGLTNGNPLLTADLIAGNRLVRDRLRPSCQAVPLTGDTEPGQPPEIMLWCVAFNGQQGYDSVVGKHPRIDYTYAIKQAMEGTSYPAALVALPVLGG